MICGIGTPSAWDRSLTAIPDSTVTGPVGGGPGACFSRGAGRSRAWRASGLGRPAAVSMTTRRFRPPGPWPRGRIGLFGPSAMVLSVKPRAGGIAFTRGPQVASDGPPCAGTPEEGEPSAVVRPPAGARTACGELPVPGDEADQLRLRRTPTTAGARPDRDV